MDDDWEALADEENVVIAQNISNNINKWDGEDEDDGVKDSWEDEEEKKDEEQLQAQSTPSKLKPKKPFQNKINEKEHQRKQLELNEEKELERLANMSAEEKLGEKLRLQQIEKDSDLKNALDTFGVTEPLSGLDVMHPTNKTEFLEFSYYIKMMKKFLVLLKN